MIPEEPLNSHELFLEQLIGKAKGQFSQPAISEDDEGDLAFAIITDEKERVIRLRFSKPVVWLGFGPQDARMFGNAILDRVNQLESQDNPPQE